MAVWIVTRALHYLSHYVQHASTRVFTILIAVGATVCECQAVDASILAPCHVTRCIALPYVPLPV